MTLHSVNESPSIHIRRLGPRLGPSVSTLGCPTFGVVLGKTRPGGRVRHGSGRGPCIVLVLGSNDLISRTISKNTQIHKLWDTMRGSYVCVRGWCVHKI